jgi:TATA-binding protein-associated factor
MLRALAIECGASLPSLLPGLWNQHISKSIEDASQAPQRAVEGLRTLEVLAPALHAEVVQGAALTLLPGIAQCLGHINGAVQLSAARAIAALGAAQPAMVLPRALDVIAPLLVSTAAEAARLGAVVAMREIVNSLGLKMVPYVQLAVVPLLGRMSDPHPGTRAVASSCFAAVVALMPLAQGVPPPPGLSADQEAMLEKEGKFLQQLLDNRQMEDFHLPFNLLTGTLRRYQQEGINWLAFLRRFGLHGVLADDMGLGKTLQATSIVAAATIEAKEKYAASGVAIDMPRPSLIICPATLVAHWPHEIAKFVDETVLRAMQYHGVPAARAALRPLLSSHDVVVMSYEAVRADVDWVSSVDWMYCVLDEGHAVRNPASKVSQAVRRVKAQHRLILSGTPIQNSVIEMWALFDFLMPGFLGGERAFNSRYGRALAASRGAKKGSSEAEAGVLALDALHRQVMPFILRRTKDQVLQDLPPKTVQDVICDPGELQRALYEDFATSQAMTAVTGAVQEGSLVASGGGASGSSGGASGGGGAPHVFQALHYLRRLCSHPLLVLDPKVPAHHKALVKVLGPQIGNNWTETQEHLRSNLSHSPKLAALRELLIDCGIGTDASGDKNAKEEALAASDAGHRALVFAQTRALLDLAESSVLQPMGISSLRIDGSVDATERFRRVQRFNADPTVEVMLLTTAVGGLGLNLTAADTVIFLEHDWNPQKDLQAMDRAHRLGQRRAVNVYRLLVRGTLEEQVMSLQKFKLDVAAAVVNAENMSLQAMDTGNLLDLFALQEEDKKKKPGGAAVGAGGSAAAAAAAAVGVGDAGNSGMAAVIAGLTDPAAAEAQYGEEFDLEAFKQRL